MKRSHKEAVDKAHQYLKKVGMDEFADKPSTLLSGGSEAACRDCPCFMHGLCGTLFDEPTSALDPVPSVRCLML